MVVRAVLLGLLAIFLTTWIGGRIADRTYQDYCTWHCHNQGCDHSKSIGSNFLPRSWDPPGIDSRATAWLRSMPISYQDANWFVYAAFLPIMAILFSLWWWNWPIVIIAGIGTFLFALHPEWYAICTEFCIHMGNWTGLSYSGFCFWLFIVAIPTLLLFDLIATIVKTVKWIGKKKFNSTSN